MQSRSDEIDEVFGGGRQRLTDHELTYLLVKHDVLVVVRRRP